MGSNYNSSVMLEGGGEDGRGGVSVRLLTLMIQRKDLNCYFSRPCSLYVVCVSSIMAYILWKGSKISCII